MSSAVADEFPLSDPNNVNVLFINEKLLNIAFILVLGVKQISNFYNSFIARSHIGLLIYCLGTPNASGSIHCKDYILTNFSYSLCD